MTNPLSKKHYATLDSFRGLCACLVALSHFQANSIFRGTPIFESGSVYVDFFFVLSGFVIFANYEERLREGFGLRKFIFLRWGRIYPLHVAILTAFIAVDLVQMLLPNSSMALYKPFSAPGEGPWDIAANLLLIHSMHVSEHLAFNGPSWSISTEFFAYILFGALIVTLRKSLFPAVALLGLACAVAVYALRGELYAKLDFGFLRCVYGFACGALTWKLYQVAALRKQSVKAIRTARDTVIEAGAVIICLLYIHFLSQDGLGSMAAPVIFSGIVWLFAFERGAVSAFLRKPFFLFLGTVSYSIYMVHMFVYGKFFEFSIRMLEKRRLIDIVRTEGDHTVYGADIVSGTALQLFYLCVVVGCSWISYRLIEEPCRNWSRRVARKSS